MRIFVFLFISLMIFLGTHLLSIFWPILLGVNVFVIWVLTVFFLDREHRLNWPVFWGTVVFFDFWSSSSFGNLTLSLLLVILIIFTIKKIILMEIRGIFFNLIWLAGFYGLYLFINAMVESFFGQFIFPNFGAFGLVLVIFWTLVMLVLASYEKRVPRFQL